MRLTLFCAQTVPPSASAPHPLHNASMSAATLSRITLPPSRHRSQQQQQPSTASALPAAAVAGAPPRAHPHHCPHVSHASAGRTTPRLASAHLPPSFAASAPLGSTPPSAATPSPQLQQQHHSRALPPRIEHRHQHHHRTSPLASASRIAIALAAVYRHCHRHRHQHRQHRQRQQSRHQHRASPSPPCIGISIARRHCHRRCPRHC